MKKIDLSDINIITLKKAKKDDSLSAKDCFEEVLDSFLDLPGDTFNILQVIMLSGVLLEAVIKEKLKKINPALILDNVDSIAIALVSNKKSSILKGIKFDQDDVKTAPISKLINRLESFENLDKVKTNFSSFLRIRNRIMHNAMDVSIDERTINFLLIKSVLPFLREHISISPTIWKKFEKFADVVGTEFIENLMKLVLKHEKIAEDITEEKIKELMSKRFNLSSDEHFLSNGLVCPSCKNDSMDIIMGVDYDYCDHEIMATGMYNIGRCKVCGLELDDQEIQGIVDNQKNFFIEGDNAEEWDAALEPNYGYDYSDCY